MPVIIDAGFIGMDTPPSVEVVLPKQIRSRNLDEICNLSTRQFRHVDKSLRDTIYQRDNVVRGTHTVVDHRVPLQLGGSNEPENLQIQSRTGPCNSVQKDKLETRLHTMACSFKIDLKEAQDSIYNGWETAYRLYIDPQGCGK
jgi:5-methylcytosine-specific restriction endonuclease McrA